MKIDGIYQKTLFRNIKTGYAYFQFKSLKYDDDGENFYKCRGVIPNYAPKTPLTLIGHKEDNGKEIIFIVEEISLNINNDILTKSFVMAHLEAGMGSVCADRVVAYLKIHNMTIENLLQSDDAIKHMEQIKGFSHQKAVSFVKKTEGSLIEMGLLKELSPYGISFIQINKLRKLYERSVRTEIKENPYLSMRRADIPFENIDAYARDHGFTFCDPDRVRCIVNHMFYFLNTTGNSYCTAEELLPMYRKIERQVSCFDEQVPDGLVLFEIMSSKAGYVDTSTGTPLFYSKRAWESETNIVGDLIRMLRSASELVSEAEIDDYLQTDGNYLDDSQKAAFELLRDTRPSFLIGGPGTGKTTTLKNLVACYLKKYPDKRVAVCAPTGRAAKRMSEQTHLQASTIHRFLRWNKEANKFQINEYNKSKVEFVLIDEASMIDTYLFSSLLKGLSINTKIIMVGDVDQLPSVGPGQVLEDLIASSKVNVIRLNELYRQQENSNIITLAYNIKKGCLDEEIFNKAEDLTFISCSNDNVLANIEEISTTYLDYSYKNFQVLAPMYKTINGIDAINEHLQKIFNPKSSERKEILISNILYREQDKVIQLTNMPDDNVFNGDVGIIERINNTSKKEIYIDFDGNVVKYSQSNFLNFKKAYATSIHKSQGSEFDIVIIPIVKNFQKMLYRKLIYTAVTRCKKKLYLIGDIGALKIAIANNNNDLRRTTIKKFLIEGIK